MQETKTPSELTPEQRKVLQRIWQENALSGKILTLEEIKRMEQTVRYLIPE